MRTVIATCSVVYAGRGNTTLAPATRAIIIKDDGAIGIHNDVGNKPINYMGKGNVFTTAEDGEGNLVWRFDARKEYIEITIYSTIADITLPLDPGNVPLVKDGTEDELQAWLFENPEAICEGFSSVAREYPTTAGSIDLLCQNAEGRLVGVEVKRVAMLGAVDQCTRYLEALREVHPEEEVSVLLAALDVRPNTQKLADKRSIPYTIITADWRKDKQT